MRTKNASRGSRGTASAGDPEEHRRGSHMLIGERRQYIVALAQKNGRVLFEELSHTLGISQITIRKDLDVLQSRGALQRTHGGALLPGSGALSDPSLQEKEGRHSSEKQRISAAAVNLVQEGECVLLDSGTTTTTIARALKKFSRLTIITNAVNIAAELSNTGFEVLLTGGRCGRTRSRWWGRWRKTCCTRCTRTFCFLGWMGSIWKWV